jgi:hypothetical protein
MGLETTEASMTTIDEVRLHPFLPLVHVAWANFELSNDKVEGVCQVVGKRTGIDLKGRRR